MEGEVGSVADKQINKPLLDQKQAVRTFTKSTPEGRQARSEKAQQILEARKTNRNLLNEISYLKQTAQEQDETSQNYTEKAAERQKDLDRYSEALAREEASWINKLYGVFKAESPKVSGLKYLAQQSGKYQQYYTASLEGSLVRISGIGERIEEIELEKTQVISGQNILNAFYSEQAKNLENVQKAKEERKRIDDLTDLRNIASQNSVYFVHGITPAIDQAMQSRNKIIKWDTSWQDRISIVLGLSPDISSSTIKDGDNTSRMWSKMGVILSRGNLVNARREDAATVVTGLHNQKSAYFTQSFYEMQPDEITIKIDESISQREPGHYNEMVVRHSEVAGFYVCLDKDMERNTFDAAPHQEIYNYTSKISLPVFVIHNGVPYRSEYQIMADGKTKIIRIGDPLSPEEVMQDSFQLKADLTEPIKQQALNALNLQTSKT